jgi:hypothetical protein
VTSFVPPDAPNVNELPSLPATVTSVALDAITVRFVEAPAATAVGLAEMLTVGGAIEAPDALPHPEIPDAKKNTATDRTAPCNRMF